MTENTVKLNIEAKDNATAELEKLSKSVKKLVEDTQSVTSAALKNDKVLKGLADQYSILNSKLTDLKAQKQLVTTFDKVTQAVASSSEAFNRAGKAQTEQREVTSASIATADKLKDQWLESKTTLDKLTSAKKKDKDAIIEQRAAIRKLSVEVTKANAVARKQASILKQVENSYKSASADQVKYRESLSKISADSKKAGINLSKMADEEVRLNTEIAKTDKQIKRVTKDTKQYTAALKSQGRAAHGVTGAVRSTGKSFSFLSDKSRKSMSIMQRLRGEVLSITAAYVGLYGIVNTVGDSFKKLNNEQGTLAKLTAASDGDQIAAAEEMEFLRGVADRLGLEFESLQKSYSSFFVAARKNGEEAKYIRTMFEGMAEGAVVYKLSVDEMDGAMTAMTQIMSKGTVQAEELQGQLAERFPGAVAIFADSMDIGTKELRKMMEQSQLTSAQLLGFVLEVQKGVQSGLPIAMRSLLAEFNRLKNASGDLERSFAHLTEGDVRDAINELTDVLKGEGGVKLVEALAAGFAKVVEFASWTVTHFESITTLVKGLIAFKFAAVLWGWVAALKAVGLASALSSKNVAKGLAQAATVYAAFETIDFLAQKPITFDIGVDGADKAVKQVESTTDKIAAIDKKFVDGRKKLLEELDDFNAIESGLNALGLSDSLQKKEDSIFKGIVQLREDRLNQLRELDMPNSGSPNSKADAQAEADKRTADIKETDKRTTDIKKTAKLMKEYYSVEKNLLKESADDIQSKFNLIDHNYDGLIARLTAKGKVTEANNVQEYKELLKLQALQKDQEDIDKNQLERDKAKLDSVKAIEDAISAGLTSRQAKLAEIDTLRNSGTTTDLAQANALEESIKDTNTEMTTLIDKAIEMWKAIGGDKAEYAIAQLEREKAGLKQLEGALMSAKQVNDELSAGMANGLKEFGFGVADAIRGSDSLGDAFSRAGEAFKEFASTFLIKIGEMILQQVIFNALTEYAPGIGTAISGATAVPAKHSGGIAGAGGMTRGGIDSSVFTNAMRYHSGGVAGLRPNEIPTILERGEEVLTKNDPRHVSNGGGGGSNVTVIDQRGSDAPDVETSKSTDSNGMEQITMLIRDTVKQQMGNGALDKSMAQFGASRQGVRR